MSRSKLCVFIRAITGHNFLGYHQHKIDPNISKVCRLCEEEYETFWHLIDNCPRLHNTRQEIFKGDIIESDMSWSIQRINTFIHTPVVYEMLTTKFNLHQIEEEEDYIIPTISSHGLTVA